MDRAWKVCDDLRQDVEFVSIVREGMECVQISGDEAVIQEYSSLSKPFDLELRVSKFKVDRQYMC